jgi:5-oxoprolinase (ATP-hydrolysing) subunit A
MKIIDLNADIGEGFAWDEALMEIVTSVNICSGAYAGSAEASHNIARIARSRGIRVGWHIGFPDRDSMGRRTLTEGYPQEWVQSVLDQITEATSYSYIKPHGALYHWLANENNKLTELVWDTLEDTEKPFLGLPGTFHELETARRRLTFIREGFCERGYDPLGGLIPRGQPGAVLTELPIICQQAVRLARQSIDSLCIHGDREDCVAVASAVRFALEEQSFRVMA